MNYTLHTILIYCRLQDTACVDLQEILKHLIAERLLPEGDMYLKNFPKDPVISP